MGHYRDRDSRYPSQVRNPFSKEPAIRRIPRGADTDPYGTAEARRGRSATDADSKEANQARITENAHRRSARYFALQDS